MRFSIRKNLIYISGFAVALLIWSIVYILGVFDILLIPSPVDVFRILLTFFIDADSLMHLLATIYRIVIAFVFSTLFGITGGLILGYYRLWDDATRPLIDFLRSIPGIALFPLFILFFGVSDLPRIMVAIFVTSLIILINTKYGVVNSNKLRKTFSKIYKLNKLKLFYKVILPEASPYIFTGLRIAISLTIIIIIVTEMLLGTDYGLGHLMIISQYQFETALMYSVIILLGIIGFTLNSFFNGFEKKVFHWRCRT